ncbi:hypothetical protein CMV_015565 [Castanea mollissima]|uniref:Leucine-rich repeat-containing N-terminal plant-type domain-containing protein n=1 Tax=Castanea mollissima TaxID=60419 RepID=A0A8J4VSH7_9ROSI|nr:hypothetical protein CMV_015565 [Castanea mollissima]
MFSMGKMNHQYLPLFLASCLFFISLSQTSSNTSSQHHCLPDQSAHLLQLRQEFVERNYSDYYDYHNGSYPKMKSWKADSDCCSWDGVTCDTQHGVVIYLDLSNSWLYGPLNSNSSLFSLRHLRKLNLALNNFSSSSIPSEFGQLVRLTHLNLSRSFLHGRIPLELSGLSNLVSLDLSFNYFNYFFGGDYHYKLLDLRRIDLEALVQNMTYLRELHLDDVNISSSLPQSLANLSSLTSLSLSFCYLQGKFPSDIFLLPKIQAIDLAYNPELAGFLPKFRSRSSLKELHLRETNFSGEFPNSMDSLGSLNVLDLSETNLFGELPNLISNLKSLNYLDLSYTKISGEMPNSFSNLKSLNYLDLSNTNFSGALPNSIGNLKSLNYLNLESSNFSGAIPSFIGNLSQLTYLSLSYTNFHGQLPSTFGNLAKLTLLRLDNILYNQKVPSFLGNLTQLVGLSLSENNFDCGFPIWLTNITTLRFISFYSNQLKGPIPSEIGRLSNLSVLELFNNSLTEAIPSVLFTIPSLSTLWLDQNQLIVPLIIQNNSLSPLLDLGLSESKMNESVLRSIVNFTKLQVLSLSSINLKGKVELNTFFKLKELQMLDLSGVTDKDKSQTR